MTKRPGVDSRMSLRRDKTKSGIGKCDVLQLREAAQMLTIQVKVGWRMRTPGTPEDPCRSQSCGAGRPL
jgi:hypothetical protein